MLLQLLIDKPQVIGTIVSRTPIWVWFMLAALLSLGLSMLRSNTIGVSRAATTPVAMAGLSLWGTISAFSHSTSFGQVMLAWAVGAALLAVAVGMSQAPRGTAYDAWQRRFHVPGSWVPLALIMGIFLVKYMVGIEVAMNPSLSHDPGYSLTCGAIYGVFSGIFAGRSIRLARLALRRSAPASTSTITA